MATISINIITKNDPEALQKAIDSVYGSLYREGDECIVVDTGSTPQEVQANREVCKLFPDCTLIERPDLSVDMSKIIRDELGAEFEKEFLSHVPDGRGIVDFAAARQIAMDASKNELVFWIDTDDVLAENDPGRLRKNVDSIFDEGKADGLFLEYQYSFNENGVCVTTQRRERIFRRELFEWRGKCHETAVPKDGIEIKPMALIPDIGASIIHTEARKPHRVSDIRNYVVLKRAYDEEVESGKNDPRTIFYIGNSLRGLEKLREADAWYQAFDRYSGSEEDRFAAKYYRCLMYLHPKIRRPADAFRIMTDALEIKYDDPRPYYILQQACLGLGDFEQSLHWYGIGSMCQISEKQLMSYDPLSVSYRPHLMAAHAFRELKRNEQAVNAITKAYQNNPCEESKKFYDEIRQWAGSLEFSKGYAQLMKVTPNDEHRREKGMDIIQGLATEATHEMEQSGYGSREPMDPRKDRPEICIFAPSTAEEWGPLNREGGVGGSEKMIIILAEALQRTGLVNVSVYANVPPAQRGIAPTNVNWRHWSEIDMKRARHTIVFWRCPGMMSRVLCPAKKRIVWNHDVPKQGDYTDEVLGLADYIQFQTKYHASLIDLPEEKVWVARNAIEAPKIEGATRHPGRVFYGSSPDRGLITACRIVKRAQELSKKPVELVTTYGLTPYTRKAYAAKTHGYIPDMGHDMSYRLYEREMFEALESCGAAVLHRIGFAKMEALMQTSDVWLYPTRFPEISCMTAMEAQANGCKILTSNYAALAETCFTGWTLPEMPLNGEISDEWIEQAARQLLEVIDEDIDREEQAAEAVTRYNVDDLAKMWLEKLSLWREAEAPAPA